MLRYELVMFVRWLFKKKEYIVRFN